MEKIEARLLRIARVLNAFNLVEICAIAYFCYLLGRLVDFYINTMTVDKFNPVAFWGAVLPLALAVIGLVKYIYHTGVDIKDTHLEGKDNGPTLDR